MRAARPGEEGAKDIRDAVQAARKATKSWAARTAYERADILTYTAEPFDLVVQGVAELVTDRSELASVSAAFNKGGWHPEVAGDALTAEYMAPSGGPPPWHVYRITMSTVVALGTAEPFGATKFQLD